jgi:hypothetical protein
VKRTDLQRAADPSSYAEGLETTTPPPGSGHHHEVVRTDTYAGHTIEVRTTYVIEVDGVPVTAHMHIDNDGNVICHAIPIYRSASMIEVVRRLIDVFPDDFPKPPRKPRRPGTPAPEHHHGHGGPP